MHNLKVVCRSKDCGNVNLNLELPPSNRFRFVCSKCNTSNIGLYYVGSIMDYIVPTRKLKDHNGYMNMSSLEFQIEETKERAEYYENAYYLEDTGTNLEDSPNWDNLNADERHKIQSEFYGDE